jgi:GNAT superfamily N-acetyltransferase
MDSESTLFICQIAFGTPEYDEAVRLRYAVLREPLGLDFTAEQLAEEYKDTHLGIYLPNGRLAGYLCFTQLSDLEYKMRQVAIDPAYQKHGIGTQLVAAAEQYALDQGIAAISMHARDTAVPFYLRLGYRQEGPQFEEVSIPHFKLVKQLAISQ